jgi:methyl-accepting chemotaxis protein
MFKYLNIKLKLILALTLSVIIMASINIYELSSLGQDVVGHTQIIYTNALEPLANVGLMKSTLRDARISLSDVMDGSGDFLSQSLEDYDTSFQAFMQEKEKYENKLAISTEPKLQALIAEHDQLKYAYVQEKESLRTINEDLTIIQSKVGEIIELSTLGKKAESFAVYVTVVPKFDAISKSMDVLAQSQLERGRISITDIERKTSASVRLGIIVALLGALIASYIGLLIGRQISRPLKKIRNVAVQIARGNLDVSVDTSGKDEIGDLSRSIATMQKSLKGVLKDYEKQIK